MRFLRWEYLFVIPLFISLGLLAGALIPFTPFYLYNYYFDPDEVCPKQLIRPFAEREIKNHLYQVSSAQVYSTWESVGESDLSIGSPAVVMPLVPENRAVREGLTSREAPPVPGVWRLHTKLVVQGRIGIMPRTQAVEEISTPLTVLPPEQCPDVDANGNNKKGEQSP